MGFPRQEYWSRLPFPSPGDLPDPGIEPRSPALQADALTSKPPRKPFYHRGLEGKSRKSRYTWSNRQVWPWITKWSRAKANSFANKCADHTKHRLPTTQEMTLHTHITRWSIPKSDYIRIYDSWKDTLMFHDSLRKQYVVTMSELLSFLKNIPCFKISYLTWTVQSIHHDNLESYF